MIDMPGKLPLPDWLTKSGDSSVGLYQTRTNKSRLTDFGNEPTVGAERIITLTKAALPLSTSRRLAITLPWRCGRRLDTRPEPQRTSTAESTLPGVVFQKIDCRSAA